VLDQDAARLHRGQRAVAAEGDRAQLGLIEDDRQHEVGIAHRLGDASRPPQTRRLGRRLGLRTSRVHNRPVASRHQPVDHGTAHPAGSDDRDALHAHHDSCVGRSGI